MAARAKSKSLGRRPPAKPSGRPDPELVKLFAQHGYIRVRVPKPGAEGKQRYNKGFEVRIPVPDKTTARRVAQMLKDVGLRPGKPYQTGKRLVVCVYGRPAAEAFVRWSKRYNREKAAKLEEKLAAAAQAGTGS